MDPYHCVDSLISATELDPTGYLAFKPIIRGYSEYSGNFTCSEPGDFKLTTSLGIHTTVDVSIRVQVYKSYDFYYIFNIQQLGVCLLSLKRHLGPSLLCQFLEYAGN